MTEKRIKSSFFAKKINFFLAQIGTARAAGGVPTSDYQTNPPKGLPFLPMARGLSSKSATGTDQMREEKPRARTTAMPSVKDSTTQENPLKRTISLTVIINIV